MDLQKSAESEPERRTRSRLEPHREAILTLRRKHWTFDQITKWLAEHGVSISLTSVYRFCERSIARRPRNATAAIASPFDTLEKQPFSSSSPQPAPQPTTQTKKHRFNLDI